MRNFSACLWNKMHSSFLTQLHQANTSVSEFDTQSPNLFQIWQFFVWLTFYKHFFMAWICMIYDAYWILVTQLREGYASVRQVHNTDVRSGPHQRAVHALLRHPGVDGHQVRERVCVWSLSARGCVRRVRVRWRVHLPVSRRIHRH